MVSLPEQPVSIGKVLDSGVKLYAASFIKIVPLAILGAIVSTFLTIRYLNTIPQGENSTPEEMEAFIANFPEFGIAAVVQMAFGMFILGAILFRIGNIANGKQDTFGRATGIGIKKFIPLFIAMILYLLAFAIGSVLLIVPGIYLLLSLSFFTYFMVNDDQGMFRALMQSQQLIRGHWWRTMTVYLAPTLVMTALFGGIGFAAGASGYLSTSQGNDIVSIVTGGLNALLYPLIYCIGYAQFHDLKLRNSGSDLEARLQQQTLSEQA